MENGLLNPELQRKLGLQSFFEGAGYKSFKEELDQLILGSQDAIDSMCKTGFVDERKLSELNFKLGRRDGFQKVLYVLEDMESELQERISPVPAVKGMK